ncbi:MAG: hypothetical protein VCD00_04720 [Candidatus Hydrogenedentota bacterium]
MTQTIPRRIPGNNLARLFIGLSLFMCVTANTAEPSTPVRGAHEGMAQGEKTDDLGITVPMAPVDFPARLYPATDEFPSGPDVGERLPDFTLPNQNGEAIDFHESRGNSKSIVVFYRSAVW